EAAVQSEEEQRELALLARRIESAAGLQSRHRRLARTDHRGEMTLPQPKALAGRQYGLGEHGPGFGASGRTERGCHPLKGYGGNLASARRSKPSAFSQLGLSRRAGRTLASGRRRVYLLRRITE